jgi:hypothetical protein
LFVERDETIQYCFSSGWEFNTVSIIGDPAMINWGCLAESFLFFARNYSLNWLRLISYSYSSFRSEGNEPGLAFERSDIIYIVSYPDYFEFPSSGASSFILLSKDIMAQIQAAVLKATDGLIY